MDNQNTEPSESTAQEQWKERIEERKQSGKSIREYCAEQGIKEHQYYHWQHKLRGPTPRRQGFVELKAKTERNGLRVEVGGCRIEVERGFDRRTFQEIVLAMKSL